MYTTSDTISEYKISCPFTWWDLFCFRHSQPLKVDILRQLIRGFYPYTSSVSSELLQLKKEIVFQIVLCLLRHNTKTFKNVTFAFGKNIWYKEKPNYGKWQRRIISPGRCCQLQIHIWEYKLRLSNPSHKRCAVQESTPNLNRVGFQKTSFCNLLFVCMCEFSLFKRYLGTNFVTLWQFVYC